jgi:hypothetical protein
MSTTRCGTWSKGGGRSPRPGHPVIRCSIPDNLARQQATEPGTPARSGMNGRCKQMCSNPYYRYYPQSQVVQRSTDEAWSSERGGSRAVRDYSAERFALGRVATELDAAPFHGATSRPSRQRVDLRAGLFVGSRIRSRSIAQSRTPSECTRLFRITSIWCTCAAQ